MENARQSFHSITSGAHHADRPPVNHQPVRRAADSHPGSRPSSPQALAEAGGGKVIKRDLAQDPVPHLTAERFTAFGTPASQRTLEQQRLVAESDALIDELRRADVLVIGLPMYNFGVPSTLKAYFDHVARAGVTFRYTADGPVGLLTGKQAYVFATRGGQSRRHRDRPADRVRAPVPRLHRYPRRRVHLR